MAIAVASFSSAGSVDGSSDNAITITKPTGLAVGDLMVAVLGAFSASAEWTTPSNWDVIYDTVAGTSAIGIYYKVADSADVAASNFTFNTSGNVEKTGGIYRITGHGPATYVTATGNQTNSTTSPFTFSGITPSYADSLFILLYCHTRDSAGAAAAFSSYAFATDDPTWGEQFDINNGSLFTVASASAVRSAATATGNISVTISNLSATSDVMGAVVCISPATNDSDTPTAITNYAYVGGVHQPISVSANVPTPTSDGEASPKWSNTNKSTTTWTNPDKS